VTDEERPRYNPLFETFVNPGEPVTDQMEGLVAYALYKAAKREWAEAFWNDNRRPPNVGELDAYQRTWTPTQVAGTRERAEGALAAFAASAIEDARPEILKEALRGSFWKAVGASIFAAVLYSLALIALVTILLWNGVDLLGIVQKAGPPQKNAITAPSPAQSSQPPAR
jgi:hypothetical protein